MAHLGKVLGRAALSAVFISGGLNTTRNADKLVGLVEPKLRRWGLSSLVDKYGTEKLVQTNGATMIAGGAALALGIKPRLASLALLGSLIPTTAAGHAFWESEGEQKKAQEMSAFLANAAVAGGLLYVASDRKHRHGHAHGHGHAAHGHGHGCPCGGKHAAEKCPAMNGSCPCGGKHAADKCPAMNGEAQESQKSSKKPAGQQMFLLRVLPFPWNLGATVAQRLLRK